MSRADDKTRHQIAHIMDKQRKGETALPVPAVPKRRVPLLQFLVDHIRMAASLAVLAIALTFSQLSPQPWVVRVCMAVLFMLLFSMIYEHRKDHRSAVLSTTLISLPFAIFIFIATWWLTEPPHVRLDFQDSSSASFYQRWRLARTITAFNIYLSELGFEIPKAFSPVSFGAGGWGASNDPTFPMTSINIKDASNQKEVVLGYSNWLFASKAIAGAHFEVALPERLVARGAGLGPIFGEYFTYSYDNELGSSNNKWTPALWDVRSALGKDDMDKAMFYAFSGLASSLDRYTGPDSYDKWIGSLISLGLASKTGSFTNDRFKKAGDIIRKHGIDWF
jgi:hypothetical protein